MLTVNELLSRKGSGIVSIQSGATVYEALRIMAANNIGALLVIENDKLCGVFSERDYARKIILNDKNSRETLLKDVMSTRLFTVTPDDEVEDCMKLMTAEHIRHLPVFRNEQLIGVISIGDVVKAIIEDQQTVIDHLENYISGGYHPKALRY